MGSIVGCGKLVKKKSTRNHKMFDSSCRKRLLVVLSAPIAANSTLNVFALQKIFGGPRNHLVSLIFFLVEIRVRGDFSICSPLMRELHPRH
jgi:hypothetical protein